MITSELPFARNKGTLQSFATLTLRNRYRTEWKNRKTRSHFVLSDLPLFSPRLKLHTCLGGAENQRDASLRGENRLTKSAVRGWRNRLQRRAARINRIRRSQRSSHSSPRDAASLLANAHARTPRATPAPIGDRDARADRRDHPIVPLPRVPPCDPYAYRCANDARSAPIVHVALASLDSNRNRTIMAADGCRFSRLLPALAVIAIAESPRPSCLGGESSRDADGFSRAVARKAARTVISLARTRSSDADGGFARSSDAIEIPSRTDNRAC